MDLDDQRRARWVGAAVFAIVGLISFPLLFGDPVDPRSTIRSRYAQSQPLTRPIPLPRQAPARTVPAATPSAAPTDAEQARPQPTPRKVLPTTRPAASPQNVPATAPVQRWTLQLASYTDAASAQRFVEALRKEGLSPKVVKNDAGGRSVWRVRLELAGTRREAESLAARLNMQFRIQSLLLARD